jgi:hypothetical protein
MDTIQVCKRSKGFLTYDEHQTHIKGVLMKPLTMEGLDKNIRKIFDAVSVQGEES